MALIVYIGNSNPNSTSAHRAKALERLGHTVILKDPYFLLKGGKMQHLFNLLHFHTGYRFIQSKVYKWVKELVTNNVMSDLIWVNSGELLGQECMEELKKIGSPIVLYNNDDPTGRRDNNRFNTLKKAIPYYDLCVVVREVNVEEFYRLGAKKVLRVFMSYDEYMHKPFDEVSEIPDKFRSEVAFIGTWMRNEKRDSFMLDLIDKGIPISIWGDGWSKSPYWPLLNPFYKGGQLGGRDYVAAIQGAKVCLGLLSRGNRDLHTQRSLEVTYIGGLLCAERTVEHTMMYKEGLEAVFWSNSEECASICNDLLQDDVLREKIKLAGMERVKINCSGNEDICRNIITTMAL